MYGGEEVYVTIKFANYLSGVVIDKFGSEIAFRKEEETHFSIRICVALSNQFFGWLAGIGKDANILSPVYVKEQYKQYLNDILLTI